MFGVGFLPYPSVFDKTFSTQFLNGGKQEKMKKRLLSMLMAVLMIASLVPAVALADGTCTHAKDDITTISIKNDAAKKQPGLDIQVCNKCGKILKDVVTPFADLKDICKDSHTFKSEVLQASNCEKPSITVTYCSKCGTGADKPVMVSDLEKVGHVYTKFTVVGQPTCQDCGWGYTVCDKCGEPEFVAGEDATSMMPKTATYAQKAAVEAQFAPTNVNHANKDAFVADTKDVYDTFMVAGHLMYNRLMWKAPVAPTHSLTVGGTPASYVTDCYGKDPYLMKYLVRQNVTNALVEGNETGHGLGYEAAKHCPYGDKDIDGKNLDGLNYSHASAMTCTKQGYYPYIDKDGVKRDGITDMWHCSVCNKDFGGEVLPYNEYYKGFMFDNMGLPTKGVVENDMWTGNDGVKATCTTDGKTATVYKYVKLASGELGWQVYTPSQKIDKLGHDLKKIESKEATCTEPGWICDNYFVCTRGDYAQGNIVDVYAAACKPMAKVLVEPTCKNSGLSVDVCSVCGDLYSYNQGNPFKYIPAVPHTAGDPVNAKEATCTEVGYTGDKVCKWCGIVLEKGKEIPMKEHTVVDVAAVAATCTTDGMTAGTKCSVCGTVLSGCEVVKALGHKFENGVCTVCGEKDPNYVPPVVNPFKDVEKSSPYYDAIIWAADKGVTTGKTADTFGINDGCTRAQIVTFLYRAAGSPAVKADTVNPFTDVSKDSVYYNAILWAVEKGITKGTTETTFDPNAVCTRGQIVTFLFRASGNEKVATGTDFADVASGSYCADAVAWAVANKVANGFADGTFRPEATCTRGQAVTFIYRALAE